MSKQNYVQVTIEVPKKLMNVLEKENYLGWEKKDFLKWLFEAL